MAMTGRSLLNSVFNLGIKGEYAQALSELGYDLEVVVEQVCVEFVFFQNLSCSDIFEGTAANVGTCLTFGNFIGKRCCIGKRRSWSSCRLFYGFLGDYELLCLGVILI